MGESRTKKSIRNASIGIVGLFCNVVVSFITRSVFIAMLGIEYNGVNGLFSNILSTLNMAELGFASAIAFSLYKPIKEDDEETVSAIMNFFAKVYRILAFIVAVAGVICIPFLQYLISEDVAELPFSILQLRIYFSMYLANTVCSYLLAYKRTLIRADQNAYIISIVDYSSNIVLNLLQILLLVLTKNYYAFLSIMIAKTIINNLILHLIAFKKYPYLSKYKKSRITSEEKKKIIKNVEALVLHRIENVILYSTQALIISAFVSLVDAGIYNNYALIVTNIWAFFNIVFTSLTASLGNLGVNADEERKYAVFKRINYATNFLVIFSLVCYICLFNDFIVLWLRNTEYVFSLAVVIAISLNTVIRVMRQTVLTFKDAFGIFNQDWYKPLISSVVAIGLSIGLSYVWGTFGILIGYSIAMLIIDIPIETIVLFKYGLNKSGVKQLFLFLINLTFAGGFTALIYFCCTFFPSGVGWFILKIAVCIVSTIAVYILTTFRTKEFIYYKNLVFGLFNKIKNKIRKKSNDA